MAHWDRQIAMQKKVVIIFMGFVAGRAVGTMVSINAMLVVA
jgi:hypothetical protein